MKFSTRLSDAVHLLLFIYLNPKNDLSSTAIAESVQTNPSYVRQLMSALKKSNLLDGTRGMAAPKITRPLSQISLLDVYRAVEGSKPLLHQDIHTNPDCGVGVNIQLVLGEQFQLVQQAAENKMKELTLEDTLMRYEEKLHSLERNPLAP